MRPTTVCRLYQHSLSQECLATVEASQVTARVGETLRKILYVSRTGMLRVQPARVRMNQQLHKLSAGASWAPAASDIMRLCGQGFIYLGEGGGAGGKLFP